MIMEKCIVCDKELDQEETDECHMCRRMLDEKYKGDPEGRALSLKYFMWLKNGGDQNETI
ncbi:MAG: hypothetical protein V1906_00060 [Candidatus Woesearchaeota archaeon]